jgi:hypothetical protein
MRPDHLILAALLTCAGQARAAGPQAPATVAVLPFDYVDTSGEVRNQTQVHAERTQQLATELRDGLTASGRYRATALDCGGKPCTAGDSDVTDLAAKAHAAGAGIMLFGRLEKQSTLISWARVRAIDTATGAVLFDKFLSFRGDDDAAWQHLECFVLRDFLAAGAGS